MSTTCLVHPRNEPLGGSVSSAYVIRMLVTLRRVPTFSNGSRSSLAIMFAASAVFRKLSTPNLPRKTSFFYHSTVPARCKVVTCLLVVHLGAFKLVTQWDRTLVGENKIKAHFLSLPSEEGE
jgi:hypothetical protein